MEWTIYELALYSKQNELIDTTKLEYSADLTHKEVRKKVHTWLNRIGYGGNRISLRAQKELEESIGKDYNFPLLKNNRKVYCSLDRDRFIDISDAMEVTNDTHFLIWLGLKEQLREKISYTILKDSIEFYSYEDLTEEEEECLNEATSKFKDHCSEILNRIEADYEYRFTDDYITVDIEANEMEFLEDGSKF